MTTLRLQFDSTLDEIADLNMRRATSSATYRAQRTRYQWLVAACLAVSWAASILWQGEDLPAAILGIVMVIGVVGGAVLGYVYGRFQDWYVRRAYRRLAREVYHGTNQVRCELELRQDVLWTKISDVESSFPLSQLIRVDDRPDSIDLWFDPGLAVVRDRAFRMAEDRRQFLDAVRSIMRPA